MTKFERYLWKRLRNHGIGCHFRRQHPLEGFVLDFYCHAARLCVEVDGDGHASYHLQDDGRRDAVLAGFGILTLRFTNVQVGTEMENVVSRIRSVCLDRIEDMRPDREVD